MFFYVSYYVFWELGECFLMFVMMFFRVPDTFLWSPPRGSPRSSLVPRSPAPIPPHPSRPSHPSPTSHPTPPTPAVCLRLGVCICVFAAASLRLRLHCGGVFLQRMTVSGSQLYICHAACCFVATQYLCLGTVDGTNSRTAHQINIIVK